MLAEKCGVAFQLTNIIRDVKEDQEKGRIYLPKEDRLKYPDLKILLAFESSRARQYYAEASGYDAISRRIRLSGLEKASIIVRALFH
jgi:15-cis-phytoene synthase